jgi:hypothetical protein
MILAAAMGAFTVASVAASSTGFGAPEPVKNAPSIRDGSVRDAGTGKTRTRYFLGGGGLHRGK